MFRSIKPIASLAFRTQKLPFQAPLINYAFSHHNHNKTFTEKLNQKKRSSESENTQYPPSYEGQANTISNPTSEQLIQSSPSLSQYVRKVYATTNLSITSSLAIAYMLSGTSLALTNPGVFVFGGIATSLVGIFGFGATQQTVVQEKLPNGEIVEKLENPVLRKLLFGATIGGTTLTMVPLIAMMNAFSSTIVPAAALTSALIMGGASLYALRQPQGKFSSWQAGLYGGLLGMIGMNVISMLTFAAMGPNMFSLMCSRLDTYVGIGLFSALQMFDTQQAIDDFQKGNYDHLNHVISFYLNFVNIFVRVASYIRQTFYD